MRFLSDNSAGACPAVMAALVEANQATISAYDGDAWSKRLDGAFSQLFGTECRAFPVATGTAANALSLACLTPPFGAVVCHKEAHIQADEAGAPEFFTGGAKLLLCEGEGGKLTPASIEATLSGMRGDVHQVQPRVLSLSQATEMGRAYAPAELRALSDYAKGRGLKVHVDGARFANAVAHHGCHPSELSWKAGVDVLSFGAVKNGGLSAEAIVFFDPALAAELPNRRKRAGQTLSKGRFQAAQLLAMIDDDVWLKNARAANAGAQAIGAAAGARLIQPVEANEVFLRFRPGEAEALRAAGFHFYDWGPASAGEARLVVSWDQAPSDVEALTQALRRVP